VRDDNAWEDWILFLLKEIEKLQKKQFSY